MRDLHEIMGCVIEVAWSAFGLNFIEQLKKEDRRLVVFKITPVSTVDLTGSLAPSQLELVQIPYGVSLAGYKVDASSRVPNLKADILIFQDDVLEYSDKKFFAITAHELTHWVVESGYGNLIEITELDLDFGRALHKMTDGYQDHLTLHTEPWCVHLVAAGRRLVAAGYWTELADFLEDALPDSDRFFWDRQQVV